MIIYLEILRDNNKIAIPIQIKEKNRYKDQCH